MAYPSTPGENVASISGRISLTIDTNVASLRVAAIAENESVDRPSEVASSRLKPRNASATVQKVPRSDGKQPGTLVGSYWV